MRAEAGDARTHDACRLTSEPSWLSAWARP